MNSPRWEERRRAVAGIRQERETVPLLPFPCRGESLKNSTWAKRSPAHWQLHPAPEPSLGHQRGCSSWLISLALQIHSPHAAAFPGDERHGCVRSMTVG